MSSPDQVRDEFEDVLEGLEQFLKAEVGGRHQKHARLLENPRAVFLDSGRYSSQVLELIREIRIASARAGYYTMFVPESIGGGGLGQAQLFRTWERLYHRCGGRHWLGVHAIAHWTKGPGFLLELLDPRHRDEVVPGLMRGDTSMCFAMSEPDAGSDLWSMRTRATRTAAGWLLNGTKQWISYAAMADYAVVFAVTDPDLLSVRKGGITAFFVPTATPGFTVDSVTPMFGLPGSTEGIISLEDVEIPEDAVLGELEHGLTVGLRGVSIGRIFNAARAVGLARWAIESAIRYSSQRVAFGQPISQYQGVTFPLADSAMEVHAARLMALNCASMLDQGEPAIKELAMIKAYATEAGARAIDRSMQVHGAMGFTNELGLAEAYQHLRKAQIADGSAEVMRRQIVGRLYQGDLAL